MTTSNLLIPYLGQNVAQPEIPVNEALDIIDASICGQLIVPMVADTTYLLDVLNLSYPQEWQYGILILNVLNTIQTELHLPDGYKMKYVIENNTGQNIVFKTVSGTGITIATGTTKIVYSNGIDIKGIV